MRVAVIVFVFVFVALAPLAAYSENLNVMSKEDYVQSSSEFACYRANRKKSHLDTLDKILSKYGITEKDGLGHPIFKSAAASFETDPKIAEEIYSNMLKCHPNYPNLSPVKTNEDKGIIRGERKFEFSNLILMVVDSGSNSVQFTFEAFHPQTFLAPYEVLTLLNMGTTFMATSEKSDNKSLMINGRKYSLDASKQHFRVSYNGDVTVENGAVHSSVEFLQETTN